SDRMDFLVQEEDLNKIWTLQFDGSCVTSGCSAGAVLISSEEEIIPLSFKLHFFNTNNTIEYESLLLGMQVSKERGIKNLKVQGDAELVVNQVKRIYQVKNERLRHYRNTVWDNIEEFDDFSIRSIPRVQNDMADSLAISASLMLPHL
ncbi:hypothetical protein KI387_036599, partial [Taxus chinensis]